MKSVLQRAGIGLAIVAFPAGDAMAWDWRVLANTVERMEFDDNLRVDPNSQGEVYGSTTSFNLNVTGRTPRSTLNVLGGASLVEFEGPGETPGLDSVDRHVKGNYLLRGPTSTLGVRGSYSRRNTVFTEFEDVSFGGFDQTIVSQGTADRIRYSVGADGSVNLDRTNALSASVSYTDTDFSRSVAGLVPSHSVRVSGAWNRQLTPRTDLSLIGAVTLFEAESGQRTESENYSVSTRISSDVNPALTIYGGGGVTLTDSERLVAGNRQSDFDVGGTFDVGFQYLWDPTTSINASFSSGISPSDDGDLRRRTGVTVSMAHQINTISSFTLGGSYAEQDSLTSSSQNANSDRTFARVFTHYSVEFARYWHFGLGYEFRYEDRSTGEATSNRVYGTISRDLVLLP